MSKSKEIQKQQSSSSDIDAFLKKVEMTPRPVASGKRGRMIFCMDATASREPLWDHACHIQAEMFTATAASGGLDVQLCYYRGFREFYKTRWISHPDELHKVMSKIRCAGGMTQIMRLLNHAITESQTSKVNALVFVGDAMEENIDLLSHKAGKLGLSGIPAFMFHEGYDPMAERAFREIARLSGGAYCRFDMSSPQQLRDLLAAVAVFASGGRRALEDFSSRRPGIAGQLTHQLK